MSKYITNDKKVIRHKTLSVNPKNEQENRENKKTGDKHEVVSVTNRIESFLDKELEKCNITVDLATSNFPVSTDPNQEAQKYRGKSQT